MLHW